MHLDSNVSWKLHIEILLKKLSVACYMMRNLRVYYYLTLDKIKTVYFTHFQSLLQSGIIFWGSTTNLHQVVKTQRRTIRVMLVLWQRTSCREKFKKLQILTVPSLYIHEMMTFVIKNPDKYQTNVSIHSRDTRQNHLHLQSVRLYSFKNDVYYSSTRIFNQFPPYFAQLRGNAMVFNNTLKNFL
jgi:hypothetical protein